MVGLLTNVDKTLQNYKNLQSCLGLQSLPPPQPFIGP